MRSYNKHKQCTAGKTQLKHDDNFANEPKTLVQTNSETWMLFWYFKNPPPPLPKEQKLKRNQAGWRKLKPRQTEQWKELNWLFVSAHWYLFCPASGLGFLLIESPWLFFFYPEKMLFPPSSANSLFLSPPDSLLSRNFSFLYGSALFLSVSLLSCRCVQPFNRILPYEASYLSGESFIEFSVCLPWAKP